MNELALASFAAASDAHLVGEPRSARFAAFKARFDAGAELARLDALGIRFLARSDPGFPPLLRAIHDPPPGLFLRGAADVELLARPAVAIVGARACSAYGRQVARSLGRDLAAAGLIVVSGLARGIDAEAHRGALEAAGPTVAVLGCGIDRDYPAAHRELAKQVAATGLLVSEYAPGVEPAPWRFPARNRIVAGTLRRNRGRRGARAKRRPDHRRLRARGGKGSAGSAGRDHLDAVGRVERVAAARRDPADVRSGRARGLRPGRLVQRRCGRPRRDGRCGPRAACGRSLREPTSSRARPGFPPANWRSLLTELELAGLVNEEDGVYRAAS